jgi:hypothetical protein
MSELESSTAVACTPQEIPPDNRDRWLALGLEVYAAVDKLEELPDGYAFRLPNDAAAFVTAAEYVTLDRLCCRFLRWELRSEPDGGPVWLRLTGPAGTKALLRSTLETIDLVPERVVRAAGLPVAARRQPAAEVALSRKLSRPA